MSPLSCSQPEVIAIGFPSYLSLFLLANEIETAGSFALKLEVAAVDP